MICRSCGCPGSLLLLHFMICLNERCVNWKHDAWDKAVYDKYEGLVNGDHLFDVRYFLDSLNSPLFDDTIP